MDSAAPAELKEMGKSDGITGTDDDDAVDDLVEIINAVKRQKNCSLRFPR